MNCIDVILDYLKNPPQYLEQFSLQVNEDSFASIYSDFYGDAISRIIHNCKNTKTDVANDMGLDPRILSYIISRTDSKHRDITFYEVIKFCIAANLPIEDSLCFMNVCNFSLCNKRIRDIIIYIILSSYHHTKLELDARLDSASALVDNEPWNDNDYDYLALFSYVRRKREGIL